MYNTCTTWQFKLYLQAKEIKWIIFLDGSSQETGDRRDVNQATNAAIALLWPGESKVLLTAERGFDCFGVPFYDGQISSYCALWTAAALFPLLKRSLADGVAP